MIKYGLFLALFTGTAAHAQAPHPALDTMLKRTGPVFEKNQVTLAVAAGFADPYRSGYTVPARFRKNDVSGFAPVYARLEYAISKKTGIGATFSYDAFYAAYYQVFDAHGLPAVYKRNHTDKVTIFTAGLAFHYHLGSILKVKRLDPFVTAGFGLNKITNLAKPQGDSIVTVTEHTVSPSVRIGARYYLTSVASLYADAGYDQQSYFSIGVSCRFPTRKQL